ncbi:hypothetical protein [Celerinatantimonas yamalensis]|uniref:Uncharacterized protein n=1 Tax=Celerinatantimonas yamalensis TaxID=559956 RepID=A0ABW9G9Z7_9GAMM
MSDDSDKPYFIVQIPLAAISQAAYAMKSKGLLDVPYMLGKY